MCRTLRWHPSSGTERKPLGRRRQIRAMGHLQGLAVGSNGPYHVGAVARGQHFYHPLASQGFVAVSLPTPSMHSARPLVQAREVLGYAYARSYSDTRRAKPDAARRVYASTRLTPRGKKGRPRRKDCERDGPSADRAVPIPLGPTDFTFVSEPCEVPENPGIAIHTINPTANAVVRCILLEREHEGYLRGVVQKKNGGPRPPLIQEVLLD